MDRALVLLPTCRGGLPRQQSDHYYERYEQFYKATTARISLKNFAPSEARVVGLAANDGMEENTLQQPTTIHPVEQQLSTADDHVMLTVPPYSLNIVTIKTS